MKTTFITQSMMTQYLSMEPFHTLKDRLSDLAIDIKIDSKKENYVLVSMKCFKGMAQQGLIDYMPDGKGNLNVAVAYGLRIVVPGSPTYGYGYEFAAVRPEE